MYTLVYSFFKVNRNKKLWLLFFNSLLEWGCANYYAGCNTGRKGVKELAKANCSSLSKKVTLGCLQDQPIFTVFEKNLIHIYRFWNLHENNMIVFESDCLWCLWWLYLSWSLSLYMTRRKYYHWVIMSLWNNKR